jgi:hypothetical protein
VGRTLAVGGLRVHARGSGRRMPAAHYVLLTS